jgi:alpha-mannosidase
VLAKPGLLEKPESDVDQASQRSLCDAIGLSIESADGDPSSVLCFNPHGAAARRQTKLRGGGPPDEAYVYAATDIGHGASCVTFDIPALGFTRLTATHSVKRRSLLKRITRANKGIAEPAILRNEFMAVSLDEETGGISGVFSASRGNRLSVRLVAASGLTGDQDGGAMVCRSIEMQRSDATEGLIVASGELQRGAGEAIADYTLGYRLQRGSRLLQLSGTLTPRERSPVASASDVWKNYFAVRTAVAGEAAIVRALVRDKVHSCTAKRMVAPLGVLIDEAEKQTLVASHGLPLHRKVGDRFLDTLVSLPASSDGGPEGVSFEITYALDCPQPVAVARACLSPPSLIPITVAEDPGEPQVATTAQAWLVHVSAPDVLITEMWTSRRRGDGKLATRMQLVQTRPKSTRVKLQFCVFAEAAFVADRDGIERSLDQLPDQVQCDDGAVEFAIGSHEAVDLVVVFDV